MSFHFNKAFVRYLVVGSGAIIVEYGSFLAIYHYLTWPLYIANSLSFGLGLFTSFCLNRLWTFGDKIYARRASHQLTFYIILALINLLLTNLIVIGLRYLGVNPNIGKLIAMVVTSAWNYILFKVIIFEHQ